MRVSISVGGKFHAFHLAEQLAKRGWLGQVLTTYFNPRTNARGIAVPREAVRTHLWPEVVGRLPSQILGLDPLPWMYRKGELFDQWASQQLQPCDILMCWSGFSLETMRRAGAFGALTIVERGSAHIAEQKRLLEEEMSRFGHPAVMVDPRTVEKELREYELADYISVPSRFAERTFLERGFPREKLLVTPLGVDLTNYRPAEHPSPSSPFRVVFVGQLSIQKGLHYLVEAFRGAALPEAELLLVGPAMPDFTPWIRNLPPRCRHVGVLRGPSLRAAYRSGSVFVLPSIHDGFAMVVLEAMASGLPVIVSSNVGAADVVRPGVDGYVVPPFDSSAIAECLVRLHDNPALRQELGQAARLRALEFTWDRYGQQVAGHLERLPLGSRKAAATPQPRPIRVSVSVGGKFHAFNLAEQLAQRDWLGQLLTTYFSPYTNARGLKIPRHHVLTNLVPEVVARVPPLVPGVEENPWVFRKGEMFDHWASRHLQPCDVFIGWSGFSLHTLRRARQMGALTILVRGSAHIAVQKRILEDEMRKFGRESVLVDPRTVEKELQEYELADYIAMPSRFIERSFLEQGLPPEKLLVWPLGVDCSRFTPLETPMPAEPFRVLYVGMMSLRKGLVYLMEGFRKADLPGAELVLVGGMTSHFYSFMKRAPAGTRHLGVLRYPHLQKVYRESSVFVLPSIEDGYAQVVVQAMASGLPVIVSSNAGASEAVTPEVSGYVVPPWDADAIADCLTRLYQDRSLCQRMSEQARKAALYHTWDRYGQFVETDLKRLTGTRARQGGFGAESAVTIN